VRPLHSARPVEAAGGALEQPGDLCQEAAEFAHNPGEASHHEAERRRGDECGRPGHSCHEHELLQQLLHSVLTAEEGKCWRSVHDVA